MPLTYLLYRCPRCGEDPMAGEKDRAWCSACGTRFTRGGEGGLIRVEEPSGAVWEVASHRLAAALHRWDEGGGGSAEGDLPAAQGEKEWSHRAEVEVRRSGEEAPVWYAGRLLGFAESLGPTTSGVLEISDEALSFRLSHASGDGGAAGSDQLWPLLHIRAVQTSSSSLQISPREGGLIQFRFPSDSPYRWECLLREALSRAYRRAGLGEIKEFQPRVVAE